MVKYINTWKLKKWRSIYFWLYAVSKLGMLYTIFQENWIGLIGFGIATGVSYVEMMKRS